MKAKAEDKRARSAHGKVNPGRRPAGKAARGIRTERVKKSENADRFFTDADGKRHRINPGSTLDLMWDVLGELEKHSSHKGASDLSLRKFPLEGLRR